jgi:hypothetical protein
MIPFIGLPAIELTCYLGIPFLGLVLRSGLSEKLQPIESESLGRPTMCVVYFSFFFVTGVNNADQDQIYITMIREAGLYNKISQAYAGVDTNKAVGVMVSYLSYPTTSYIISL